MSTSNLLIVFQELSEAGKRIPFCAFNGKSSAICIQLSQKDVSAG
jgi:hypothetical protein